MSDPLSVIRDFLMDQSNHAVDAAHLERSQSLIEDEVLDSLGLMVLVEFLGDHYAIEFDPGEIVPENFQTLETIAALVDKKLGSKE